MALVIVKVEAQESSRSASSSKSLPLRSGPDVGTTPTAVPVELALKKRPEPAPTVKSLVKTLWPPRESRSFLRPAVKMTARQFPCSSPLWRASRVIWNSVAVRS